MVSIRTEGRNGSITFFGLTEINIENLRNDKPILFDMEEVGGSGHVVILLGENEEAIVAKLRERGILPTGEKEDAAFHTALDTARANKSRATIEILHGKGDETEVNVTHTP